MENNGDEKLVRIVTDLDFKFDSMRKHFEILVELGRANQAELRNNHRELKLEIKDLQHSVKENHLDLQDLKDMVTKNQAVMKSEIFELKELVKKNIK